eukprot:3235888-Rhodomonas_salina.1
MLTCSDAEGQGRIGRNQNWIKVTGSCSTESQSRGLSVQGQRTGAGCAVGAAPDINNSGRIVNAAVSTMRYADTGLLVAAA